MTHDFGYDTLDRLTALPVTTANGTGTFAYALGLAGHRLTATGLNGRRSTYGYDEIYRLISESITTDPTAANNGTIGYGYDAAGNRLSMTSTLGVIPGRAYTYDANDRLGGDTYDANGNTLTSGGYTYTYDYEDRLIQANTVGFVYDGDGSRVRKTVGASVTRYLVDELNPTGYSQVVEEILNGSVQRTYTYGLQRISQDWAPPGPTAHFYVYDGHGSVRALTDVAGAVTDAYEYDAFGNLVAGSGNTANHNLYVGEHFDVDFGLYYLRARWYRPMLGRFVTADPVSMQTLIGCCRNIPDVLAGGVGGLLSASSNLGVFVYDVTDDRPSLIRSAGVPLLRERPYIFVLQDPVNVSVRESPLAG